MNDLSVLKSLPKVPTGPSLVGPVRECAYPSGDALPYQFCGERTLPGSSYCAAHHHICYTGRPAGSALPGYDTKPIRVRTASDWHMRGGMD